MGVRLFRYVLVGLLVGGGFNSIGYAQNLKKNPFVPGDMQPPARVDIHKSLQTLIEALTETNKNLEALNKSSGVVGTTAAKAKLGSKQAHSPLTGDQEAALLGLNDRLYKPALEATYQFNKSNFSEACHHLRGALEVTIPGMKAKDHIPAGLYERVREAYYEAEYLGSHKQRAIALRRIVNDIRNEYWRQPNLKDTSLGYRLGGECVLMAVTRDAVEAVVRDVKVEAGCEHPLTTLLAVELLRVRAPGLRELSRDPGPFYYPAPCYPAGVSHDQFHSVARHLRRALRDNSVPEYEIREFMKLVRGISPDEDFPDGE